MVCHLATKGILQNMSLFNVRLLGLLPRVEYISALIACIAMDNASSTYSLVLAIFEVVPHVAMFLEHILLFDAFFCIHHWTADF